MSYLSIAGYFADLALIVAAGVVDALVKPARAAEAPQPAEWVAT